MYFFIEGDDLQEMYNTIWDKGSADIEKILIVSLNKKSKIKSHGDGVIDFYDKEIPEVGSNHTCIAAISLDSALNKDRIYYLQVPLKECKYVPKNGIRHINDNLIGFLLMMSLMKNKLELVLY